MNEFSDEKTKLLNCPSTSDCSFLQTLNNIMEPYVPENATFETIIMDDNTNTSVESKMVNGSPINVGKRKRSRTKKEPCNTNKENDAQPTKIKIQKELNLEEFYKNFQAKWTESSPGIIDDPGNHDNYINATWNIFNECYENMYGSPLLPFDLVTDLFYIKQQDFLNKTIIVLGMSDNNFLQRTGMFLPLVRRILFANNILILNVLEEDSVYDYYLNKVVVPYMYFANASQKYRISVKALDENKEKPLLPWYTSPSFEDLMEFFRKVKIQENVKTLFN